ncbi:hypothetical protein F2Q70_00028385 [Brassica cretica]|uniref:Uncharacterized protein n=1 Tax=Brassica cretica TaxID=69181 RepID=A0A8S9LA07_BRACR|nr:hypothetical protein F2Q70_00028385 [Brassica cretica]
MREEPERLLELPWRSLGLFMKGGVRKATGVSIAAGEGISGSKEGKISASPRKYSIDERVKI